MRDIDGILYMNSGDWVESLTALVEDHDGNWTLVYYNEAQMGKADEPTVSEFFGVKERAAS